MHDDPKYNFRAPSLFPVFISPLLNSSEGEDGSSWVFYRARVLRGAGNGKREGKTPRTKYYKKRDSRGKRREDANANRLDLGFQSYHESQPRL